MLNKFKNSYKQKQHLTDIDGVSVSITTKAKSKHFVSFTYHIERDGYKVINLHHRLPMSESVGWCEAMLNLFPKTHQYRPKIEYTNSKFENIDQLISKECSELFR